MPRHLYQLFAAALFLSGCGGGGGEAVTTVTPPASAPSVAVVASPTETIVSLDSTVSATSRTAIVKIASPFGSAAPAAVLSARAIAGTEAMLFGMDAQSNIVVAGFSEATATTLGADSTALALARILMGPIPAGLTPTQVNVAIRAAAEYPRLVERVTASLAVGQPPAKSVNVLQSVTAVLSQSAAPIVEKLPTAGGREQPLQIDARRATQQLPFTVVAPTGAYPGIYLTGGGINVFNGTPIEWTAHTETYLGAPIPNSQGGTLGAPQNATLLPPLSPVDVTRMLAGQVLSPWLSPTWLSPNGTALPDDGGRSFNLVVEQDRHARRKNLVNISAGMLALVLEDSGPCAAALSEAYLGTDRLWALADEPTFDGALDQLKSVAVSVAISAFNPAAVTTIATECASKFTVRKNIAEMLLGSLNVYYQAYKVLDEAISAAWLVTAIHATASNWNAPPVKLGICQSKNSLGVVQIANCAKTLEFKDSPLLLATGAIFMPAVLAFDIGKNPTGLPSGLEFTSAGPPLSIDKATGRMTTDGFGGVKVGVIDPATDAKGEVMVGVSDAKIVPANVTLEVNALQILALQDSTGQRVRHVGTGTTWSSLHPLVAEQVPLLTALGSYPDAIVIQAKLPGRTTIEAVNPNDPAGVMRTEVIVRGQARVRVVPNPIPSVIGGATQFSITAHPDPDDPIVVRPTGSVVLRNGSGSTLCGAALAASGGPVVCSYTFTGSPRLETVTAAYSGDVVFHQRDVAASIDVSIGRYAPVIALAVSPASARVGASVSFTSTISAPPGITELPTPSGTITVRDSAGITVCVATLSAAGIGTCSAAFGGPPRTVPIVASYSGDSAYVAATAQTSVSITEQAVPVIALVVNPTSAPVGASVSFTSTVAAPPGSTGLPTPSGTITVRNSAGGTVCVATLSVAGIGTCSATLGGVPRTETIVASYNGDPTFESASSATSSLEVVSGTFDFQITNNPDGTFSEPIPSCERITQNIGDGIIELDRCYVRKGSHIRCVGPGCVQGRFWVSVTATLLSRTSECGFPPDGYCQSVTSTQVNYGVDQGFTGVYVPGSLFHFELRDGNWQKGWPSCTPLSPLNGACEPYDLYFANFNVLQPKSDFVGFGGYIVRGTLDLTYSIFDTWTGTTYTRQNRVTVP
ncbi:MAG: Ig-like domain-containing protein [Burkholderiales bacterium]|nr:Ig-like domain-containing protein [Burkholderiales bacterium]